MPLLGQASGGWTESSSALRILNLGIKNTLAVLTDDSFTQTNPPAVSTNVTAQVDPTANGVLGGSVAFARPEAGSNATYVGGPGSSTVQTTYQGDASLNAGYRPLGVYINSANGNAYENLPGVASGLGPYVSGQGTYGNQLFETKLIAQIDAVNAPAGHDLVYIAGAKLVSSRNGYLMPQQVLGVNGALFHVDLVTTVTAEAFVRNVALTSAANLLTIMQGSGLTTEIGVLKLAPDSAQNEIVYDQRV